MKMNKVFRTGMSVMIILLILCTLSAAYADGNWVCPACGQENPARAHFCGACRTEKPSEQAARVIPTYNGWLCPACQAVNAETYGFCINCGRTHTTEDQPAVLIDENEMTTIRLNPAVIEEYQGTISGQGKENTIPFTAPVTGTYLIFIRKANNGFRVSVDVRDLSGYSQNSDILKQDYGFTVSLRKGTTYNIYVAQYEKTGDYTLAVGIPRECADIGKNQLIEDSVSFRGQENCYRMTAPRDGTYRFSIIKADNGVRVSAWVTDEGGYVLGSEILKQGTGVSVTLRAGETYTIHVSPYEGYDDYVMRIGIPQPTVDLTGCQAVGDRLYYYRQDNTYTITPQEAGTYIIALRKADQGMRLSIEITDMGGYRVNGDIFKQGNSMKFSLKAGLQYTIHVIQYDDNGEYTLTIDH